VAQFVVDADACEQEVVQLLVKEFVSPSGMRQICADAHELVASEARDGVARAQ
jgi:hypothetical protein